MFVFLGRYFFLCLLPKWMFYGLEKEEVWKSWRKSFLSDGYGYLRDWVTLLFSNFWQIDIIFKLSQNCSLQCFEHLWLSCRNFILLLITGKEHHVRKKKVVERKKNWCVWKKWNLTLIRMSWVGNWILERSVSAFFPHALNGKTEWT